MQILNDDVPAYNKMLDEKGVPYVAPNNDKKEEKLGSWQYLLLTLKKASSNAGLLFYVRTIYIYVRILTMGITTSKLRQNIYKLLDQVAETGEPLEIRRKGKILKIIVENQRSKLAALKKRDVIVGDSEELVHIDWSSEWSQKPI